MALGPRGFKQYAGHFWGFLEPALMRARAGLAGTLLQAKAKAEGKYKGRKPTARARSANGVRPVDIARRLGIGRASVYRVLAA